MSNVATLKLQGTSDLTKIVTDLKGISTESKTAGTNLKGVTTELDKGAKTATSFGQKLKGFGSQFSSSIATIGTLGGTVLNLSRQYQDLGDSQIAVDKAQLKVSKSTEATKKAQDALNKLVDSGITSGAKYEQALLDVKQAQEQQSLAEQLLTERQEDHQRAQENFWIGLVPTVTSAGASIMTVLNDIGGTKGLGGLKTALTGFGGKAGGLIGGLVSGLAGIGGSASGSVAGLSGMTKGVGGLSLAMKGLALSALPVTLAIGGIVLLLKPAALLVHEVVSLIKGDTVSAIDAVSGMMDFIAKIAPVMSGLPGGAAFTLFKDLGLPKLKEELAKVRAEAVKTAPAIKTIDPALQAVDNGAVMVSNTMDGLGQNLLGLIGQTGEMEKALPPVAANFDTTGAAATGFGGSLDTANGSIITFVGGNIGLLDALSNTGIAFGTTAAAADPLALAIASVGREADAANAPLAALTKNAQANAKAFQNSAKGMDIAAKSLQRLNQIASKGPQYPGVNSKPGQGFRQVGGGVQTKKNVNGPSYTLNGVTYYGSVAPPNRKQAASGMHEMVNKPTWILAGEAGQESVHIDKPGRNIGGGTTIVNVYVDGVLRPARYDMGARK